jgi:FkbM family methyltransferase
MSFEKVKQLLERIGLRISRIPKPPYEYLLNVPRYEKTVVGLLGHEFTIADSLSFFHSYKEIFLDQIYKFKTNNIKPLIIDCGANYGTSIVYFKTMYPGAKIIAVEADPNIFQILQSNLMARGFDDVQLMNKAVSNSATPVNFFCEGADAGRIHKLQDAKNSFQIESISLNDLIKEKVDFLKIDIEGAETEVICSSDNLDNVAQIFIEYHSFMDSEQTLELLLEKLKYHGFRYYIHTQFCSPRPLIERRSYLGMDLQLNIFAIRTNMLI